MKNLILLTLTLFTTAAFAIPEAPFDALNVKHLRSRRTSPNGYDFEGIVKLSNCSGSLVKFQGMPDSAKAVVTTNGHCIQKPGGYLDPKEVWVNRPVSRTMKIFDKEMQLFTVTATQILYATMTDTDMAFYELTQTYEEIRNNFGIESYVLDVTPAPVAQPIEIISGYWDLGYTCDVDGLVFLLREGGWSWTYSIRYTAGCDTKGGTSGSPIIAKGEKRVIGINNTSNRDGQECTVNNPCEVDELGAVSFKKGTSYGQQTYKVYSCLTPDFRIDLSLADCALPKGQK